MIPKFAILWLSDALLENSAKTGLDSLGIRDCHYSSAIPYACHLYVETQNIEIKYRTIVKIICGVGK